MSTTALTELAQAPSTDSERRRAARTFVEVQDLNAEEFGDFVALEDPDAGPLASVTWARLKQAQRGAGAGAPRAGCRPGRRGRHAHGQPR